MFHPNNPDLDLTALTQRVRHHAATRRRPDITPMAVPPAPVALSTAPEPTGWRARVRRWPVVGPALAYTYRGVRAASRPGLGVRARVRALPFVGALAAWFGAVATLPRWRRHLHEQDARLTQDVAALRAAQTDLMRELVAARLTIRTLQSRLDAEQRERGESAPR